jgi:hypothetical protein
LGWIVTERLEIEGKLAELRGIGMTPEQTDRVLKAAKTRAYRSTAPNGVAINCVIDVAIYKATRGDNLETVVAELEAIP